MNILRISHGNVARHSFTVAFASEDAKGQSHVFEHPLAMLSKGNKGGDSWETGALTDHFEGSFLLLLLLFLLRCCCCGGNCIVVIIVLVLLLLLLFIALNCLAHDANGGLVMLRSCQCCRSHDLIYKYSDLYCSQKDDEEEEEEISRLESKTRKDQSKTVPVP